MTERKQIQVLIVDDEVLALNLLENFIERLSDFKIVAKAQSPIKALEILQSQSIDLMFLDIQMPALSGTNLLKALPQAPVTIFITAYSEHAAQAFDLNAADYLLKPFAFERFLQAVIKAKRQLNYEAAPIQATTTPPQMPPSPKTAVSPEEFVTVKVEGDIQKIYLKNIVYVEGMREYVRIVCEDKKKYITLESLKNMEEMLPREHFMRIHRSYIAAKAKAARLSGNSLEIREFQIPISRSKKQAIIQEIFR